MVPGGTVFKFRRSFQSCPGTPGVRLAQSDIELFRQRPFSSYNFYTMQTRPSELVVYK